MKKITKVTGILLAVLAANSAVTRASAEELTGTMVTVNAKCFLKYGDKLVRLDVINDAYLRPYLSQKITVEGRLEGKSIDVDTIVAMATEDSKSKVIYDWAALNLELYR